MRATTVLPLLGVVLLCSCGSRVAREMGEMVSGKPPSAVFLLVDVSISTASTRVQEQARKDFATILDVWSKRGGQLRGDVIGADVLNRATVPLRVAVPAFNAVTSDSDYHEKKVLRPALAQANEQFGQLLATKPATKTEILNALSVAAKVFNGEEWREAHRKALVIFSDMVEESDLYDFKTDRLDDRRIAAIIEAERVAGRLPALQGVRVWKAGSAAGAIPEEKLRQIEKFWLQYFQAAGAVFPKERYAAAVLDFALQW
ncbi:MAG: hypothetical protein JNL98_36275 [Bryobacterales bacterium]|nr:hypothetical protein [Bryobacterales bacterium]